MAEKIVQTAGRMQLGSFAPEFVPITMMISFLAKTGTTVTLT